MNHRMRSTPLVLLASVLLAFMAVGCRAFTTESVRSDDELLGPQIRGIWVTRWDYITEADVRRAIRDSAALGATDVFFQVRGQADAYYRSDLEPWGEELFRGVNAGKTDPGFDPLAVAITQARRSGIRVHAWINVMPLWKGEQMPADRGHILHTRPEFRISDENEVPQALNDHYVIVNPVHPEVQDHIVAVAADIVSRYDVDGLHLDYIRFVSERLDSDKLFPGDRESVRRFRSETGGANESPSQSSYRAWIRSKITGLVSRIRTEAVSLRPGVELTAAVWRRPEIAREQYLQDAANWAADGLVDVLTPMIYSDDNARYKSDLDSWLAVTDNRQLAPGIGIYQHANPSQSIDQIEVGGSRRFALFAYATIFESASPDQDRSPSARAARRAHRDAIAAHIGR